MVEREISLFGLLLDSYFQVWHGIDLSLSGFQIVLNIQVW